ncbi:MAG TPA: hypothetical protein DCZ01_10565 [Elusimicrobia bacterium]|nr:MAG: hypothetical protein A2X37_11695 [Elusimicrobia bacterium GWA2_66_18]OGR74818.1 MAG: hypothetical protein A2X40_12260 [Elusimicrobia bacterium GWC2_65_9]HAZ08940.1 hypothetical protein [Elusimicrobiota bacterium]
MAPAGISRGLSYRALRRQVRETATLARIAQEISSSLLFEDILDRVYKSFRGILPYDRIGLAVINETGHEVIAIGARSNARKLHIETGYTATLKTSSLEKIIKTGKPRIINDLRAYLHKHPESDSTRRIVAEGIRSNLTFPLCAQGKRVGFIFFSSRKTGAYTRAHIDSFQRLATMLSIAVEKGRLYREATQANEMKNRLLGIAAHDLRNPLTVVIGYLTIMQDEPADIACQSELTIVMRKCKQMLELVDGLLDSSILESRGLELNLQRLDLDAFLKQICADSRILAEAKSISLELKIEPDLPALSADRVRLQQTFENLISNAIKYSPPAKTVSISARAAARCVEVCVSNEGQGIPKEELPRLFKEFGRANVRPTGGERSVGLGLSIAQRIAKAHGGSIRVENLPGTGASFIVSLPYQRKRLGKKFLDLR